MGHRHNFNTGQMFDSDDERSWKHMHPEQPYRHFDGMPYGGSHWNSNPRANVYPSSNPCVEMPHRQSDTPGSSRDPFVHPPSVGNFSMAPEIYAHHASSSNFGTQTFNRIEDGLVDIASDGRGPFKRKSPGAPSVCETGSSSRYYNTGTSSNLSMLSDVWQEQQTIACHHAPWDSSTISNIYGGHSLPVGNDASLRNVRSRALFESENTLSGTDLSTAPSHQTYIAPNSCPIGYIGHSSDVPMREWGHLHTSHAAPGRSNIPDANAFNQEKNNFRLGGNNPGSSLEVGAFHNNFVANRTPVPQSLQGTSIQAARGSRSSYSQRSAPTFRGPSSSNMHWEHSANSSELMQLGMESYPSRHQRPFSSMGWRTSDRSGRSRISSDRFRSLADEAGLRHRLTSEGLMIVDRSAVYGSRNLHDHHSDMRLDIDNMSYEELLALGERIGSVSTGLSEDLISKCLTVLVYCSPDQSHEEERCVICLDEYKNMDEVGSLRSCGHDFHVGCIKKWLLMKNICPICKASALADQMKNE